MYHHNKGQEEAETTAREDGDLPDVGHIDNANGRRCPCC
jgi:hypothetical protein